MEINLGAGFQAIVRNKITEAQMGALVKLMDSAASWKEK